MRYYVFELKTGRFQPEYAGKLNFYVAVVDDVMKREFHNETVGILICGSKNDHTVRYSQGHSTSPMAVSAYTYEQLPAADKALVPGGGPDHRRLGPPPSRRLLALALDSNDVVWETLGPSGLHRLWAQLCRQRLHNCWATYIQRM